MGKSRFVFIALMSVVAMMLSCKPQRAIEPAPVYEDPKSAPDDPGLSDAYLQISEGATYNFGNVDVLDVGEVTLTLINEGIKDATNIAVSTDLGAPFAFKGGSYPGTGGTCGADLSSDTSCDIVLEYTPSSGGTFSDIFVLDYESEGEALEFSFGVLGSSGEADVTTDYDPALSFSNTLLGDVNEVTVTMSNGGDLDAKFISDAGALSAPFAYKGGVYPGTGGTCGVILAAGEDCTFVLEFAPTTPGAHVGAWGVGYLSGGTVAGAASLILNGVSGLADLEITDYPEYTYAATFIGDTTDRTFTISNTGNFEAADVSDELELATPFAFAGGTYPGSGGTCTDTIAAGDDCTIVVRFEPVTTGTFTDTLEISYNDGDATQSLELDLSALGRGAILELTTGSNYNFGRLAKGDTEERTVTIQNIGNYSATSVNDSLAPTAPFYFAGFAFPGTGGTCASVLSAGASCTVVLQYSPTGSSTTLTTNTSTVEFEYDDGTNMQTLTVTLEGEAGLGSLSFSSTSWGNRVVGTPSSRTITVTNNGTFAVTDIEESAGFAAPFYWTTSGVYPGSGGTCQGAILAPSGTCTMLLTFTPDLVGAVSDTVDISYNNGFNTQTSTRTLSGTGVLANLVISSSTYDFGNVSYNDTFSTQVFTIQNTGGNSASSFTRSGLAAPFTISATTCGTTLAAGASCTVTVRFQPTTLGLVSDVLDVSYNDGQSVQATTLDVEGTGSNTAPVASDDTVIVPEDDPGTMIVLAATDANGNALTYSIVDQPSNGDPLVVVGNTVTYTPTPSYNGPDSFTFRAHDGTDFSNTATVTITVTP